MRNAVLIILGVIVGAFTLMSVMTIGGRRERSMELEDNLPSVVEETVEAMFTEKNYSISDRNEFIADLIENLAYVLDSESEITVEITGIDVDKGLLSVRVRVEYEHPNGDLCRIVCERTVILDQLDETEPETYTVSFYVNREDIVSGRTYKCYQVLAGDTLTAPVAPASEEGTFAGWLDVNDYVADFSQPVTQDLIYYAAWQ